MRDCNGTSYRGIGLRALEKYWGDRVFLGFMQRHIPGRRFVKGRLEFNADGEPCVREVNHGKYLPIAHGEEVQIQTATELFQYVFIDDSD